MACCVSITQPTYLPWLGYFDLIARSDVFVFLDHVQFEKQSWQNRNRLKGSNGQPFWLTIPVASHDLDTPLCEILIAPNQIARWQRKHLQSIRMSLGAAPFFDEVIPHLEDWFSVGHEKLSDLTVDGIQRFAKLFKLPSRMLRSSELGVGGTKAEMVVEILKAVGADHYRANAGSRDYTEEASDLFAAAAVTVSYQDWQHPVYPQPYGAFLSHLAFVDALCHLGIQQTGDMLRTSAS